MRPAERVAVVAITAEGGALARRIAGALGGAEVHGLRGRAGDADVWFTETVRHVRELFEAGRPVAGVCAAGGILVRSVAPALADKRAEPPVVAISDDGAFAVPLLGGHRGGVDLARRIAGAVGGTAAVTTAGDRRFGIALDAPPAGWTLANPEDCKPFVAALLQGARVCAPAGMDMALGSTVARGERTPLRRRGRARDPGGRRERGRRPPTPSSTARAASRSASAANGARRRTRSRLWRGRASTWPGSHPMRWPECSRSTSSRTSPPSTPSPNRSVYPSGSLPPPTPGGGGAAAPEPLGPRVP